MAAQFSGDSHTGRFLRSAGYECDWEEKNPESGLIVNLVDFVKLLS